MFLRARKAEVLYLAIAGIVSACGRNPGAVPRGYPVPGIAEIEKQISLSKPRCVAFDAKGLGSQARIQGKERFVTETAGRFRLEAYEVSGAVDQTDRSVPNFSLSARDFSSLDGRAPRILVEAECLDLKGSAQELVFSPVSEIDSANGAIVSSQPFGVGISTEGRLRASSARGKTPSRPVPISRVPEAAVLLGEEMAASMKTLRFDVRDHGGGSIEVTADFAGFDSETFARRMIRVRAVYAWDPAP